MWNKNEREGKAEEVKGAVKDKVGELVGNPELEEEGEAEQVAGKLQRKAGKAQRKIGETLEEAGRSIAGK